MTIISWLKKQSRFALTTSGLALVMAVGITDYLTPARMSFTIFYLVPVLAVTWYGDRSAGVLIASACSITWFVVDRMQATPTTPAFIPYWNAICGLVMFLAAVFLMSAVKALSKGLEGSVEQRTAELTASIAEHKRTEELLRTSEQQFRQFADSIREVFWMTDPAKTQMLYVSPSYEKIWGRTCESLYASPRAWLDAIHPDDRERVQQAATTKQASGDYDEEYRIVRPSGSVRWIRDRAFPIMDAAGNTYRIAGIAEDITERKLTESQLATLVHAVESTAELICITDLQDRFIFVNRAFQKAYGYSKEEILGKTPEVLFSSRNLPSLVVEVLKQTRLGGWQGEVLDRRKDGTEVPIRLSTSLVKDGTGKVLGLMGVARDITERKLAEDALRRSEEKYRSLFETSYDAIMISEPPSWRFTSGNPATVKMFGAKNEDEFISHTPWELSPERQPDGRNSAEKAMEMIGTAVREGSHFFEWTHRRIGGEEFPATVLLTKMERDRNVFLQATVRDITERKRDEEQLRLQSAALEAAANGIVITDCQGNILWVNPAFTMLTGYTAEEVIGKNLRVLKSGRHDKTFYQDLWQTILSGQAWRGEMVNKRKDGSLYIEEMMITPVRDGAGKISRFIAIKQDVTERKRLEKVVLEISDREQARIGQDLHDGLCQQLVRTAFASHLLEKDLGDKSSAQTVRARQISVLLDDAITQARNIARGLYPVKLGTEGFGPALRELCAGVSQQFNISCELVCQVPVLVEDDAVAIHLYRIAREALMNAVKHAKCNRITMELAASEASITLKVIDNGSGICSVEGEHKGMGIHIMSYRARLIGALLEIRSEPSGGTLVCCSLRKQSRYNKESS